MQAVGLSPVDCIEHISYFLFLKWLDDQEEHNNHQAMVTNLPRLGGIQWGFNHWLHRESDYVSFVDEELFRHLRSLPDTDTVDNSSIRELFRHARLLIRNNDSLSKVLHIFDQLNLAGLPISRTGEIFEAYLERWAITVPELSFTNSNVTRAMVDLVAPKPNEAIYDPACGTGGFLVGTVERWKQYQGNAFLDRRLYANRVYGYEVSPRLHHLALINLILHGCKTEQVICDDSLPFTKENESKFDIILSNPPTGINRSPIDIFNSHRRESQFLEHSMRCLRPGGRAALLLPDTVLWREDNAMIRKRLLEDFRVEAVIALPPGGVSKAFSARSNILLFQKAQRTISVWFADLRKEDLELDAQQAIMDPFLNKMDGPNYRNVDINTIEQNDFILIPSHYQTVIRRGGKYPWMPLGEILTLYQQKLLIRENNRYVRLTVRQHGEGITQRDQVLGYEIGSKERQQLVKAGQVVVSKIDAKFGAFGIVPPQFDGAIVSHNYYVFDIGNRVIPEYLSILFQYDFLAEALRPYVRGASGHAGIRATDLLAQKIPVPPPSAQREIVERIAKRRRYVEEAQTLLQNELDMVKKSLLQEET